MPLRPQLQIQPEFLVPFTFEVPGTLIDPRKCRASNGIRALQGLSEK